MKKFILPLMLLLLAAGFLFAVESDPSAVVGYVKYDCLNDLNLIALPMNQGYTSASDIGLDYAGIDAISYWDASNQRWYTAVYYPDFEMWDPEFAIEPGDVLMINALSPLAFYSIGGIPATNPQYHMIADLNTIMVPLNRSDLELTGDLGADIGVVDALSEWDALNQRWYTAVYYPDFEMWDPDFPITIGKPLMTNALTANNWPARSRELGKLGTKQSNN